MNKTTFSNFHNDEMLDDYSDQLTSSDVKKAVRGNYAKSLTENSSSVVKITGEQGDRYVTLETLEVEALVNSQGQLTIEISTTLKAGKYHAVLIVEELVKED